MLIGWVRTGARSWASACTGHSLAEVELLIWQHPQWGGREWVALPEGVYPCGVWTVWQ